MHSIVFVIQNSKLQKLCGTTPQISSHKDNYTHTNHRNYESNDFKMIYRTKKRFQCFIEKRKMPISDFKVVSEWYIEKFVRNNILLQH